jgi:hypothetical protein
MSSGGSCRHAGSVGSGQVKAGADEFPDEGDGDNLFGGAQFWPNDPEAGAEEAPDQLGCGRLTEALGDDATWM